ncbi:MAG: prepilin-type N-terminal cleavage/methylation domain-containing protein [Planctomycetota bacterium]|jgi:prepilin-type N-terminal cleavage/methylation domain-containing protein
MRMSYHHRAQSAVHQRGFTLIELLMVMGLMAILLGVGVGAVASIDLGSFGSGSLVRSTLRSASNWSRARQAPAHVKIDSATGMISAEGLAVVGTWHFESIPPKGAFGLNGEMIAAELVPDGFVGRALSFTNASAGAAYEVPIHTDPAFGMSTGFQVQIILRPESSGGGRILQMGEALRVDGNNRYGLRLQMATQRFDPKTGKPVKAGIAVLDTPNGTLKANEWNRVLINYDRTHLEVFVEGLRVASLEEEGDVVPIRSKLVLGGGQRPWPGSMDGLVISAVGATEEVTLPVGVSFGEKTPTEIFFDADGGLDRSRHQNPILIPLEYDDGRTDMVRVSFYGTVE